jgi:hypothetical protein
MGLAITDAANQAAARDEGLIVLLVGSPCDVEGSRKVKEQLH